MGREMSLSLQDVTDLMLLWEGLQHPREVVTLLRHLERATPRGIVEVGTFHGGLAACFALNFPEATVVAVDIRDDKIHQGVLDMGVKFVKGDSQSIETRHEVERLLGGTQADFVFIDAAHDCASVLRDYSVWGTLAPQVGFHDLVCDGVAEAWGSISHGATCSYWKEFDGFGIGVLGVPSGVEGFAMTHCTTGA